MFSKDTLSVIAYAVSKGERPQIDDWSTVIKELQNHACLSILMPIKKEIEVPEEVLEEIKPELYQYSAQFVFVMHAQQELLDVLKHNDIIPAVIKGAASAQYYELPASRTYGDIDILLYNEAAFNRAIQILMELGYSPMKDCGELSFEESLKGSRHFEFDKNGIEVELHSRYVSTGSALDTLLSNSTIVARSLNSWKYTCFPDMENGLILLQHVKFHINYDGVGLRLLLDWAFYVKSVLSDAFWNDMFEKYAEELGLKKLAICLSRICEIYFGLESHMYTKSADETICRDFLETVYESGNFGVNHSDISKKVSRCLKRNLFSVFRERGIRESKTIQKYKFLRPFAWIYGAISYANIVIHDKGGIRKILEGKEYNNKQIQLNEKLGLL